MKRLWHRSAIAVLLTTVMIFWCAVALADVESDSLSQNDCLNCHGQQGLGTTLSSGEAFSLYVDPELFHASVHGDKLLCTHCHANISSYPHPQSHIISLRQYGIAQNNACQTCHQGIFSTYTASIHGKALADGGNYDVPVCTDCHSAHAVEDPREAAFRIKSMELCSGCHGNRELMEKYGISPNVVKSYLEDFHGRTVALVAKKSRDIWVDEAVCTDCHGVHDIQAVDSPDSPVIKENLVKTCAKCHPDATANFPNAWLSHYEPTLRNAPVVFLVRWFYRILIPFILLGLLIHILLDLRQRRMSKSTGRA